MGQRMSSVPGNEHDTPASSLALANNNTENLEGQVGVEEVLA